MTDKQQAELEQAAKTVERTAARMPALLGEAATTLAALSPLALCAAIVALGIWWYEHDARIRQAAQVQMLKKQTQADVSRLETQASQAVQEANQQRAHEIDEINARNRSLERDQRALEQRLEDLVGRAPTQAGEVATLPTAVLAERVATRLDLTRQELAVIPQTPSARPAGGAPGNSSESSTATPAGGSESGATLNLSEDALRKMDVALVELDNCKQQSQVQASLVSNCHDQLAAKSQVIDEQKASLAKLNEALAAKDQILTREQAESRAELKAARGNWQSRAARVLEMVAVGVVIGVAATGH